MIARSIATKPPLSQVKKMFECWSLELVISLLSLLTWLKVTTYWD